MTKIAPAVAGLVLGWLLLVGTSAQAYTRHIWSVPSPDHEQTFAYGSEQNRVWVTRGSNHHLAVLLNFTNDPYVDRNSPRQYDNFIFHFPNITLGTDGRTFYYHTPDGRSLPVTRKQADPLDADEIHLLPTSYLVVKQSHGYLSLTLMIQDHPFPRD